MKIIVGLGNLGQKYTYTRHNTGFLFVDYFSQKHGIKVDKIKFKALYGQGIINGQKVILVKPQTFMNLSGESVMAVIDFFKCSLKDVVVVYDDISLDVGKIRIRTKGSDGGHNGIKSIIYLNKSDEFDRIKIGVGNPPHKDYDLADYVLSEFSKDEQKIMFETLKKASEAAELIIDNKLQQAMNSYNS